MDGTFIQSVRQEAKEKEENARKDAAKAAQAAKQKQEPKEPKPAKKGKTDSAKKLEPEVTEEVEAEVVDEACVQSSPLEQWCAFEIQFIKRRLKQIKKECKLQYCEFCLLVSAGLGGLNFRHYNGYIHSVYPLVILAPGSVLDFALGP